MSAAAIGSIDWNNLQSNLVEPNYSLLSSACVLYYDYLLTLSSEVGLVWCREWGLATAFSLMIRYGTMIVLTLGLIHNLSAPPFGSASLTPTSCEGLVDAIVILNAFNFAVISAFVAIRISALWSRNFYLGIFLFLLGLVNPVSITPLLVFGLASKPVAWPSTSCVSYVENDDSPLIPLITKYLPIATALTGMLYESLCLLLTVLKTYSLYREQRKAGLSTRFTSLLLRDGSLYFAVLSVLALLNIISASLPLDVLPPDIQINSTVARVLTPILITRFIAHLRTTDRGADPYTLLCQDD
ncbi:hypothetical protein OH77DRAFT_1523889 [Trametes cingulata]|nr:hypothetical protein OH77DRAFT_1523889 [Trametes cingulata]